MKTFSFKLNRYEGNGVTDQALVTIQTVDAPSSTAVGKAARAIKTDDDAMNALCRATARWIEGTEDGKALWGDTGNDLNIADLQGLEEDDAFTSYLHDQGIEKLSINIDNVFAALEGFTFDTVLPNRVDDFKDPEE